MAIPPQVYDGLLVRANAAKAETEGALSGIKSNLKGVEDTLTSLRGTTAPARLPCQPPPYSDTGIRMDG